MAGDVPELGTRVLVVTDGDRARGEALAEQLGREIFALRGTTMVPQFSIDAGLDRALARIAEAPGKPVVIADVWDNPGGGVAGDGTLILRRMLERGLDHFAVATIWDPIAVSFCRAAGEGAILTLRFGGKAGPDGGAPIDAEVEVRKAVPAAFQSFGQSVVPLGPSAVVRLAGTDIDIILNTNRTQTFEPDVFTNLGIDFARKAMLLVKSTNHFYAGFAPVAAEIVYIDAGAPYPSNPRVTAYKKLDRPIWPRVEDPWAGQ
jgi:microcystin degradation protein MlrC